MQARAVVLVVDVANVMGARPDGWWRDRAGAATRLLDSLDPLVGEVVPGPDGKLVRLVEVVAVLEGQAKGAHDPEVVEVRRAESEGDDEIAATAAQLAAAGRRPLVVTADRGLRARLPKAATVTGPRWLLDLL